MGKTTFQSVVIWSGHGVKCEADIRGKKIIIDEPPSLGGTDEGANPVELVLAALGGCISILTSMYAKKHRVDLKGVKVFVEGDLDPDGFMEKDPSIRPGFQEIRFRVEIDSPSSPENVETLLEHVERICPVKDTLKGVPVREQMSTK
ncbi:MAG: OsmC family protein [Thermicanus sp.]|nr:OsmC family protein [Thermicanus sp.]